MFCSRIRTAYVWKSTTCPEPESSRTTPLSIPMKGIDELAPPTWVTPLAEQRYAYPERLQHQHEVQRQHDCDARNRGDAGQPAVRERTHHLALPRERDQRDHRDGQDERQHHLAQH